MLVGVSSQPDSTLLPSHPMTHAVQGQRVHQPRALRASSKGRPVMMKTLALIFVMSVLATQALAQNEPAPPPPAGGAATGAATGGAVTTTAAAASFFGLVAVGAIVAVSGASSSTTHH